jgi:hypothetical protein
MWNWCGWRPDAEDVVGVIREAYFANGGEKEMLRCCVGEEELSSYASGRD